MTGGEKCTVGRGDRRGSFGASAAGGGDEAVVEKDDWLLGEDAAESADEERLRGWGSDDESESESQSSTVGW